MTNAGRIGNCSRRSVHGRPASVGDSGMRGISRIIAGVWQHWQRSAAVGYRQRPIMYVRNIPAEAVTLHAVVTRRADWHCKQTATGCAKTNRFTRGHAVDPCIISLQFNTDVSVDDNHRAERERAPRDPRSHAAGQELPITQFHATWRTWRNIRVVFDYGLLAPLCENIMSSAKPEVNNIALSLEKTELRSQITWRENFMKYGHVVFEIFDRSDRQTDRQTDTLIAILLTLTVLLHLR